MKWLIAKLAPVVTVIFFISPGSLPAATVFWVGGSGDWTNTANWSTGALPGPDDNVVISPATAITVTHSAGMHSVNSIMSGEALVLSGGQLTVTTTLLASNTFTLSGGVLQTAAVVMTNEASFVVHSGTFNGVTVNGVLDVGNSYNGAQLVVTNGLTLNGTLWLGNPTNNNYGSVAFAGSQTLGGNGTVVFGKKAPCPDNALLLTYGGTTLTIGSGILVHGQSGTIGYDGCYSVPGNVSVINFGTISADVAGGTIALNAQPFNNQGIVSTPAGVLNLSTVTGTLNATNGVALVVSSATFNGVTVNGVLDVGNSYNGAQLVVTNGLTLNGTLWLGNPTNNNYGSVAFAGSQTLGGNGTVVFGKKAPCPDNALLLTYGGTTLTIGSGILVRGQNGTIGYDSCYGGPANVSVTNLGTISADVAGGTIVLNCQPFNNQGNLTSPAGILSLNGTLDNTGNTLIINTNSGSWNFAGGTIRGGSIVTTNGASFVVKGSGTFNGVTVNGVLDVGNTYSEAELTVTNGLVLNGTALVGNPTNGWYGQLDFAGSQTLSGNGTVVFGNNGNLYNALWLVNGGTTLTLGSGILVHGQNGTIGDLAPFGGPANVSVINQGTISADVSGGTISVVAQPFTNLGLVESPAGALSINQWQNSGQTIVVSTNTGSLHLSGGTIIGGTITVSNGASCIVSGNPTLNGVTVNGVLDVGNSVNGAALTVTNGLTLNGTALVGNPTNGWYGQLDFAGSQTLSGNGTVVFGNNGNLYNALWLVNGGTTLTLGSGILVHGQNGTIGDLAPFGGPANVSVINQGTISADVSGGTISVVAQPFTNLGLVESPAGTLLLQGTLTTAGLGNIQSGNGPLALSGVLTNNGTTLVLNGSTNVLRLQGGTILGGSVTTTGGASLIVQSGTLNGVTVNGVLDMGNSVNGAALTVTNGLTLNGTALVGNPTNGWYGQLDFAGSQTLSGNGTVVFGNNGNLYNALWLVNGGTTLTLGSGILVHGQNGTIGDLAPFGGPANVSVINQGTISADVSGGTISVVAQPFTNLGLVESPAGALSINQWQNSGQTIVVSTNTGSLHLSGGTIIGGTITVSNGASCIVSGNPTLNGVTVNGVLDVGNSVNGAALTVTNGLTLNGTALVGNPTNGWYGQLDFAGSQTLSGNGTVVFGNNGNLYNALWLVNGGTTLTLGSGILVHGQNGTIGDLAPFGGPANVSVINQGTISADVSGGTISVVAQPFTNLGLVESPAGTLLLQGTLTTAGLGNIQSGNGPLALSGVLTNNGTTLVLNGSTNVLRLQGGTILGGSVTTTGGASLIVQSGTLNGVTVNGVLDMGNSVNGAALTVTNGLTLNGTALVGNPTNGWYGQLDFAGSQTLSGNGTVVFGNNGNLYNALWLVNGGTTLTLGSGILVHGQNGTIGDLAPFGGPANVSVINQGTISADVSGGTISVVAQPFTNLGLVESPAGALSINQWQNSGQTIVVSTNTGSLHLSGGTIIGGTITVSNGASCIVSGNPTLNGVTVNGVLDVGNSVNGAALTVTNGLTLNGTALVGNPTNGWYGQLDFAGSQTLSGNGTVVFGNNGNLYNALWLVNGGTTLTLGSGILVHGQNGTIGDLAPFGGPANVSVINQGTILADVTGGTISLDANSFQNLGIVFAAAGNVSLPTNFQSSGTLEAGSGGALDIPQLPTTVGNVTAFSGGTINFAGSVYFNGLNALDSQPGSMVQIPGSLLGDTKNLGLFNPLGTVIFDGSGTASSPQLLEVMGADLGTSELGFIHNFNYGTITLANHTYVQLVNQYQNSSSTAPEALYVNSLVVPTGTTLNMNGFHVYARATQIGGTILNGTVTQIPNSGSIGFGNPSLGNIATAGQLDQWTFFARAGQFYTVLVDPGSDIGTPPYLGYVKAQVVNSNGVVLASNTNASNGAVVLLSGVAITNDGTYSMEVQASAISPGSTGHYMVTIWQTTPNVMSLPLGQVVSGSIQTPYSLDEWQFGAVSNSQVQFHLVNVTGTGVGFDLIGPNGWEGFTNLTGDSSFITLPTSGNYSVNAHSLNGQYGAVYAFELNGVAITNLSLGTQFEGDFATTGQGQLLEFNVTTSAPLQVVLNNLVTNNHAVVYAQLGKPPTPSSYAYSATVPTGPNQQLLIPVATAGTWYVLVYGDNIQTPGAYKVTVSSYSVILNSLTPNISGLNQPFTITLSGAGFDSSSSVQFIDGSNNVYPASSISVDSFTQITVTESAGVLAPGIYSLRVSSASGNSATLTNVFQVLTYGIPNLVTSLTLPGVMGYHIPSTLYANYGNSGGAGMPAPLLVLTASQKGVQGAILTLNSSLVAEGLWTSATLPAGFGNSVQFLGSGQTPGLLQPGESFQVPVYYAGWQQPWNFSYPYFNWNLGVIQTTDTNSIDWTLLETNMQPSTIPTDAWSAIFMAFTNDVGSTWGDYVAMLDNNSSYLGRLGLNVADISKLLAFQLMQADGLNPLRTLASSVDASVPTPGLPLTFSRSFGERISQRYAFGALGRGWSHNWQYSLQQGSDGTVTIFGPGGSQRVFLPNTQSGGYWAQAGDYGTLASGSGGTFTLTEKTGLQYFYAANGTLSYIQDLNGNTITLGYTGNLLTSLTHSSGQFIHIGYNGAGLVQTITDNFGHQTILTYDVTNQHLTGAQYFDGRVATYNYNTSGSPTQLHALTALTSSDGTWRYFNYDSLGRLVGTYLAGNAEALTFSYGIGGQVKVTDTLGNVTQFFYDNNGLPIKTVDANGNAVHLSFDNNYNLISVMDPAGRSYNFGYDSLGNVTSSTDPLANQTQFSYTSSYNRLASVTDAKGNPTHYSYDPYGNLESITYADGSVEDWTYDDVGNPQTWNNRRGHQTFNTFNDNGQVTGKYFADGSETSYEYDGQGHLTNVSTFDTELNPLESSSMSYDGSNRLTHITYPGGKYLNFTYDSTGRRTSSVDQLGHQLTYYYDMAGQLQSMTNELNALVVLYQYDAAGNVAVKTLGNGMFTTYQYEPAGQLLNLTNFLGNGNVISLFNYTYDNRGRRTTMTTLDGNWTYTYDDVGQLINAVYAAVTTNVPSQNLTYTYDSVGNRTQSIENGVTNSYSVNNLNQYYSVGQTNYTFDADGNLIKEVSPQGTNTYTYSDENRLLSITSPQGNWQYTYDGWENRTVITGNGAATRNVIDPTGLGNVVGEYDSSGNLIAHYDHALGLLSRIDSSGNWAGYTFDAIGNIQQMVGPTGAILNSYAYRPFGGLLRNITAAPNPFQYLGKFGVMADASGLNSMRYRYFSPTVGRFMSQDPLNIGGGDVNIYKYARNQPTEFVDPFGLDSYQLDQRGVAKRVDQVLEGIEKRQDEAINMLAEDLGWFFNFLKLAGGRAAQIAEIGGPVTDVIGFVTDDGGIARDEDYLGNTSDSTPIMGVSVYMGSIPVVPNNASSGGSGSTVTVGTADPNQLIGPAGYGANGFVVASNLLAYRIDFENSSNAAAPAQQVNITDQLSTNYDWTTFNVSEIGFGNLIISLPPGVTYFATNVPYSYLGTNFQVQIQIGIQPNSGEVYANFQSIDPTTSLPPPVNIGFLPPEDGTGRGMGHITYTIHAKGGLPNGTQLNNVALISFNQQPSIATDQIDDENPAAGINPSLEASITLDSISPTSYVLPLPAQSQLLQVPVSWTGQDNTNGPGIASYNIYVSDNGSPWTLWQSATTATNATFQGRPQHSYGFMSQATDNAGLTEPQHATADTSTTIIANPQFQFTVTPASTNLTTSETFSYIITVKNIGTLNLENVTMSNSLPDGIDLDYVEYGHGSCDIEDTYLLWSLGNMNTNSSASMNVTADAAANGIWTNSFAVADSQGAASSSAVQVLYIGVSPPVWLSIALTNNDQVVISWPLSASNYGLQTTTNISSSTTWAAVLNSMTTNGNTISVNVPVTATNQFFRLKSQ